MTLIEDKVLRLKNARIQQLEFEAAKWETSYIMLVRQSKGVFQQGAIFGGVVGFFIGSLALMLFWEFTK